MTIWSSINLASFRGDKKGSGPIPNWLCVSLGIGAENIYGALYNSWTAPDGNWISLDRYPRHKQYYLSLDIDTARIRTSSPFLKTLFSAIRWIKIPAPTLEYNPIDGFRFHPIYW